jgi:NADP-dependent 3-hydroxy acid dehydrogenase YdfG
VVIVTGASSGIGEAFAREMARRGWKVGLIARRADLLAAIVAEVRAAGGTAAAEVADVTDRAQTEAACARLEAELGPCDLLVANAGYGKTSSMKKLPIDAIIGMSRLNYEGAVFAAAAVLPGMLERRAGRLAVVSSVAANRGLPASGGYSASKAAVSTLWEAMRIDLRGTGVHCTTIHPGFVESPLNEKNKFKMPFIMPAARAARIMADGLERGRDDITFPWQMALISVVMRWIPRWLWTRLAPRRG